MIARFCLDCGRVVNREACTKGRCPACASKREAKRDAARGTPAQRGYGPAHRQLRARLLAAFRPGQPCARCGLPITSKGDADLGHTDDRQGYRGLEHRRCNRGAPNRKAAEPAAIPSPIPAVVTQSSGEPGGDAGWCGIL